MADHDDLTELVARVDGLERLVGGHEVDGLQGDMQLVSEAFDIIRRVLADLVGAAAPNDANEYVSDLDRLDQLRHLIV